MTKYKECDCDDFQKKRCCICSGCITENIYRDQPEIQYHELCDKHYDFFYPESGNKPARLIRKK